jgi:hypothetical protein
VTVPDDVFSCCCDWGFGIVQGQGIIYEIFAYGGKNTIGATSLATNVGYSITGDSWATRTNKSVAATSPASASLGGEAYSQGGFTGAGTNAHNESYNPGSNAWTTKTSLTFARNRSELMEISDFGVLAGGRDAGATSLRDTEEYDPSGDSWSTKADTPRRDLTRRQGISSVVLAARPLPTRTNTTGVGMRGQARPVCQRLQKNQVLAN